MHEIMQLRIQYKCATDKYDGTIYAVAVRAPKLTSTASITQTVLNTLMSCAIDYHNTTAKSARIKNTYPNMCHMT